MAMKMIAACFLILMSAGCGGSQAVPPGTRGLIHAGGATLSDIQVTVHRAVGSTYEPIGHGVSSPTGEFGLIQTAGAGSLWLEPGEYAFTLESVGPEPLAWPADFALPESTPLTRTWTGNDELLDLDVPEPQPKRR